MARQVVTITPESSILDAARLMLEHKISGLPVVDDGSRLVGIISEHDLLRRAKDEARVERRHWLRLMIERANLVDESARFHARKVAEVMTSNPVTIAENATLEEAGRLIGEHGIKRLPVVRNNHLVGVIARADLVRAMILATRKVTNAVKRSEITDARLLEMERQLLLQRAHRSI